MGRREKAGTGGHASPADGGWQPWVSVPHLLAEMASGLASINKWIRAAVKGQEGSDVCRAVLMGT